MKLKGLVAGGTSDYRKTIIGIEKYTASYFSQKPTLGRVNKILEENGEKPLAEEEIEKYGLKGDEK